MDVCKNTLFLLVQKLYIHAYIEREWANDKANEVKVKQQENLEKGNTNILCIIFILYL